MEARRVTLADGTPAVIRPIRHDGGPQLTEALRRLSPESRYHRFLSTKETLSPDELYYLTHCDGVNHLALVLAITDLQGHELEAVAVARCIRDSEDEELAEAAIVVADAWQRRGVGKVLMQDLAERARQVGIRRWQALFLSGNTGARRLMEAVAWQRSERSAGQGVVEAIYDLVDPSGRTPDVVQAAGLPRRPLQRHQMVLLGLACSSLALAAGAGWALARRYRHASRLVIVRGGSVEAGAQDPTHASLRRRADPRRPSDARRR